MIRIVSNSIAVQQDALDTNRHLALFNGVCVSRNSERDPCISFLFFLPHAGD
jgi:hypothetical protein